MFAFSLANAFLQLVVMSSWLFSWLFNSSDVQFFMALSFSLLIGLFACFMFK